MADAFPSTHTCGHILKRVYSATPVHYNSAGFYSSDVTTLRNQIGPERFARFEARKANIEARAAKGQLTDYEKALE